MIKQITSVVIPSDSSWKIANSVSRQALFDAALRIVLFGGDGDADMPLIVNLRSDDEVRERQPAIYSPTATFGKLNVIDREEIEGYRSVEQLLVDYMQNASMKPISIGVFGPPGSGKSFGVTEVVNVVKLKLNNNWASSNLQFNLAQFSNPLDLSHAFLRIRNEGTGNNIPLVFFDEFDSALEGNELGWLRYFLPPMQDGKFFFDKESQNVGKAILVFAGGTCSSFRAFAREDVDNEQERAKFRAVKGFDFVSRLGGNVNVLGVNHRDDNSNDPSYVLRRAVVIRSRLREENKIGRNQRALVNPEFLKKLLNMSCYKHGARSIEMIIRMCVGEDGVLHLPPGDQLMMHISKDDAERLLS